MGFSRQEYWSGVPLTGACIYFAWFPPKVIFLHGFWLEFWFAGYRNFFFASLPFFLIAFFFFLLPFSFPRIAIYSQAI